MIWQLTILISSQILFNIVNAFFDAYRIAWLHKKVAHGINFGMYAIIIGLQLYLSHFVWWFSALYCFQAFVGRQVFFDIPLNIRRGIKEEWIKWHYQTINPKALMDRIENFIFTPIFGKNGRAIHLTYIFLFIVSTIALYIVKSYL